MGYYITQKYTPEEGLSLLVSLCLRKHQVKASEHLYDILYKDKDGNKKWAFLQDYALAELCLRQHEWPDTAYTGQSVAS